MHMRLRVKQRRGQLLFGWVTTERSCPCMQPACPVIGGGSEVPRLSATGLCEDLIKQNNGESRYSTRSMVLIKSATVTDRIRTCAISNSDSKSNDLDRSAVGSPRSVQGVPL
ncbi:hypothetical protein J6590_091172 [Homalodisca vitripennis]|nr:hypothetical protein J6590_091172 [Homalodisca vitripennis]